MWEGREHFEEIVGYFFSKEHLTKSASRIHMSPVLSVV